MFSITSGAKMFDIRYSFVKLSGGHTDALSGPTLLNAKFNAPICHQNSGLKLNSLDQSSVRV